MTILYRGRPPVKPHRRTERKPGRFARGLLASRPTIPVPFAFEDEAWWALEHLRAEDRHFDRMAVESRAVECHERGLIGHELAEWIAGGTLVGHLDGC
jgi:hypothetical protein